MYLNEELQHIGLLEQIWHYWVAALQNPMEDIEVISQTERATLYTPNTTAIFSAASSIHHQKLQSEASLEKLNTVLNIRHILQPPNQYVC